MQPRGTVEGWTGTSGARRLEGEASGQLQEEVEGGVTGA